MTPQVLIMFGLLLLAVIVGMVSAVLLELRRSLRQLTPRIARTAKQAEQALSQVEQAAGRVNRIAQALDGEAELERLATSVRESSEALNRLGQMLRTASAAGQAVGPAVAAFVGVLAERRRAEEAAARPAGSGSPQQAPAETISAA